MGAQNTAPIYPRRIDNFFLSIFHLPKEFAMSVTFDQDLLKATSNGKMWTYDHS